MENGCLRHLGALAVSSQLLVLMETLSMDGKGLKPNREPT